MMPTQQEDLYAAEDEVSRGRQFDTLEDLQRFVDELRDTAWWVRDYPMVHRVEAYRADQRTTHGSVGGWHPEHGAGKIEMWVGHWYEQLVLHELAHVLAHARCGDVYGRTHGPVFAREYANLTYHVRGSAAWLELQAAYERHGIDYA